MASIRAIATEFNNDIQDGICWVAIWKNGRSWCGEFFYDDCRGSYEDGYYFSKEDIWKMEAIMNEDSNAIMINGYYTNCGTDENRQVPVSDIINCIEWNYYNHYNTLRHFYEGWVIKNEEV